jgi:hypothetical protein
LGRGVRKNAAESSKNKVKMTVSAAPADAPARKSFKEVWLITIGHC